VYPSLIGTPRPACTPCADKKMRNKEQIKWRQHRERNASAVFFRGGAEL
jgi:hypothetical protein